MFKEKLVELRKSHNETQEALAYRLHVSRSLVAKWEQGRSFPSINELNKICEIYKIEFEQLLSKNELKDQYGIILKKNKNKNMIIAIMSILFAATLITIGLIYLFKNPSFTNVSYEKINIVSVTSQDNPESYGPNSKTITLEDGTTIENVSINDGNDYTITFDGESYSNVMINYITNGNHVDYKIIYTYNIFKQIIKTEKIIENIDFNCPILKDEEVHVIGAYIPLTDSTEFNEETCLFINFSTANDTFAINGNLFSWSYFGGLVDNESLLPYTKASCKFNLDKDKLHWNENNSMGQTIKRPLIYIYSNGDTSLFPINNFTLEKEIREYSVDPWTTIPVTNNNLSKYFIQDVIYENDEDVSINNIYLEFEIINKVTPDYYELLEFDSNGNYIGKQYIYSYDDLDALIFNPLTEKLLISEIKNNKIIGSTYVNKGEWIKLSFSNDYGIFKNRNKFFE